MRATIESGSIVSHYRILAPIGAGGMGEVYKAHDQILDRAVALKVLPGHLVRNEERVRRFVQEAKAASSLNHPHIVTIHEIGEAQSSDDEPVQYIAMELIDGVTLRRKIQDPDADLRTLLGYLVQVAEGLAKAHASHIVHRDLKPENIMITRDGYAKVLDFGLAKLVVKKSASDTQVTAGPGDTREGALIGTVAYMSPEQVRGTPADQRSDIFAFGSILYEVCTKRRPFDADTDVDVMHRIVYDKPAPIDELNPNVPAEVRRMVRRCMAKEPDKRYHSMKDVALELSEIVDEFEQLSASNSSASISGPVVLPRLRRARRVAAAGLALFAIAAAGFGVLRWLRARSSPAAQLAFSAMKIRKLTSSGNVTMASISPDGKYLAHSTRDAAGGITLWVRQIATGTDVHIVGPGPGFGGAVFTHDGSYLYFTQREKEEGSFSWLYQVPAVGGTPRKLLFDVDTPIVFSADGLQFAFGRGVTKDNKNLVMLANADGTGERKLAELPRYGSPRRPAWSPDGRTIVVAAADHVQGYRMFLYEIDVATGQGRRIGSPWFSIADLQFMPDGRSILMTAVDAESGRSQVWLQPYPDGTAVRLTNDSSDYYAAGATSDGGTISAVQEEANFDLRVAAADDVLGGKPYTRLTNQQPFMVSASRSGPVVIALRSGGAAFNVAIIDAPGAEPRLLTSDGRSGFSTISADGRTIVFGSEHSGTGTNIFAIDADGSRLRQVTHGNRDYSPVISGDGRMVLFSRPDGALWATDIDGREPRRITDRYAGGGPHFSADGTRIAYQEWPLVRDGGVPPRLKVVPLAGGPVLLDVPGGIGRLFRFHPNGQSVTYIRFHSGAANIWSQPLRGGEPVQITKFASGRIIAYDWLPDGRLLLLRGEVRDDVVLISDFRK